jgi:hypothetical protein
VLGEVFRHVHGDECVSSFLESGAFGSREQRRQRVQELCDRCGKMRDLAGHIQWMPSIDHEPSAATLGERPCR